MILLLKTAASMMIVGTVVAVVAVLVVWLGYGFVEESQASFPLWIVFVVSLVGFLNFLIGSFLFGVAGQVATNSGADQKEARFDDKLSDTIDEGWPLSLVIGKWTFVAVSVVLTGLIACFFSDLKFLIGFHKGMESSAQGNPAQAQKWFGLSVEAAGNDRVSIARFLLAGSLIRSHKYAEAELELQRVIKELDEKNDEHLALLVYAYSALSNCYMFQDKFDAAESWTKKAIKVIEEHPQMYGLRLRLIGPYKQFLIPEPPPLAVAISGLNDIYVLEKKPELALSTYKQILAALEKQPSLKEDEILYELNRFANQMHRLPAEQTSAPMKEAQTASAALAVHKCHVVDEAKFSADFEKYKADRLPKADGLPKSDGVMKH